LYRTGPLAKKSKRRRCCFFFATTGIDRGSAMRSSSVLVAPVLGLAAAVLAAAVLLSLPDASTAKKDSAAALMEKVQQLSDLSTKRPVIRLNGNKFRELVRNAPRNYSMVVMFTAMASGRGCAICKQAADEYQLVANSYRYSQQFTNKLFFAMVDFDEGPDAFQIMNLNSAPVFMHFPEKGKPKKPDTMDIQRLGFGADAIAKWVAERTDVHIKVFRPPNYSGTLVMFAMFAMVSPRDDGLTRVPPLNADFLGGCIAVPATQQP
jgi:oligosaccharyltransferase complex subunit gamma